MHKGNDMLANRLRTKLRFLAIALITLPTLAGCVTGEAKLTLYRGDSWEGTFDFTIRREMINLAGGEEALDAQLQAGAEEELATGHIENLRASYEKIRSDDQAVTYRFSYSGDDLDSFNTMLEGSGEVWSEESTDGKRLVHFHFAPDLFFSESQGLLAAFSLSLTGGEIVSSNADKTEDGTAIWYDLAGGRTAEATLTGAWKDPLGGFFFPILGGLVALLVAIAIVLFARKRLAKAATTRVARFCGQCGAKNAADARFCIKCGTPLG